jgi:HSP20 family protein
MRSLIPWRSNERVLDQARNEMDDLFSRFFGAATELQANGGDTSLWAPRVDISETDKAFVVKADLPGVEPKDVDVSVHDGILTLKGEKREQREEKQENFHRMERFVGQFFRSIPLSAGADEGNVNATTTKGVLTISIPKMPEAQPKKIAVKAQE